MGEFKPKVKIESSYQLKDFLNTNLPFDSLEYKNIDYQRFEEINDYTIVKRTNWEGIENHPLLLRSILKSKIKNIPNLDTPILDYIRLPNYNYDLTLIPCTHVRWSIDRFRDFDKSIELIVEHSLYEYGIAIKSSIDLSKVSIKGGLQNRKYYIEGHTLFKECSLSNDFIPENLSSKVIFKYRYIPEIECWRDQGLELEFLKTLPPVYLYYTYFRSLILDNKIPLAISRSTSSIIENIFYTNSEIFKYANELKDRYEHLLNKG